MLNKKGKVNKAFVERWCELRGQQIDYYKKAGHRKSKGSIMFGSTAEVSMELPTEENKLPPHCFCIQTSERAYVLQADSDDAAKEWLEAIKVQRDMAVPDIEATTAGDSMHASVPEEQCYEEDIVERDLHVNWDPGLTIVQELEAMRRDRRQLLQYVLWQKQQLDTIKEHAAVLEPDSEEAINTQVEIMNLCGQSRIKLPPAGHGARDWQSLGAQLDFDTVSVPALLDNLADPKGPCSDLSGAGFARQELR